ncbi:MAG: class I SAM-dependent methyltransferase [Nanoarchaeota archaeon]
MIKKCPVCGKDKIIVLYKNLKDKDFFIDGIFRLLKCKCCGLEFLEPRLNEKELSKYYPKNYYSFYNYNKLALLYHKISAYYYSRKGGVIKFLLEPFRPLFYTYYIKWGKSVLEIGCGNGMKLHIYQKYGMKTAGIEPYIEKITEAEKKIGVIKTTIEKAPYKKNSFDYIILKEVLEHIPDQKKVLKKCYELLKKYGKLIITIPNTKSLWNIKFKENWYGYDIPRHLYNYNPKNIKIILKKFNFKIEKIRIYDLPYMLDGSLKFKKSRNPNKKLFIFSNFTKIITAPVSLIVSYLKLGSIMEITCSK